MRQETILCIVMDHDKYADFPLLITLIHEIVILITDTKNSFH